MGRHRPSSSELRSELEALAAALSKLEDRLAAGRRLPFDQHRAALLCVDAHVLLDDAVAQRDRSEESREVWKRATATFQEALAVAYPPDLRRAGDEVGAGNPEKLEVLVKFLEDDPYFFSSGYTKAEAIRRLKRVMLPADVQRRLREVVVAVVRKGDRRELRSYCRLARLVAHPSLVAALEELEDSADPGVRRRAAWTLIAMRQAIVLTSPRRQKGTTRTP